MLCTSCGSENEKAEFCTKCGWQLPAADIDNAHRAADDDAAVQTVRPARGGVFRAVAWLKLSVRSAYASSPRGFSATTASIADMTPNRRALDTHQK
jgi:hypothetical protein